MTKRRLRLIVPAKRCFILGAGFSKCCGLPLARELTPVIWRARARDNPTDTSPHAKLVGPGDFGYEAVQTDLKAIRLLFPSCDCDPDRDDTWPDFEELITALNEAAQYQESFEKTTKMRSAPWAGITKKRLLLSLEERMSELTEMAPPDGLEVVKEFLHSLDPENDAMVSFNWDVLIEIAAADLGLETRYQGEQRPGLQLAKPHGSLNLVDSARDKYEETARTAINVHSLDAEFEYVSPEPRVVLRAHNPRQSWLRQAWAEARLLVEPNIRKTYASVWLDHQWARALRMVLAAEQLIVIGFSLPPTDLRPRLLFQLTRAPRRTPPRLLVVDPRADPLREWYRERTGLQADPFAGPLKDWLRQER